jgi:hypothetical protein
MKTKTKSTLIAAIAMCATLSQSNAATIALFDARSNIDGVISPASGLLDSQGLGTINLSVTGVGNHFLGLFVDHEIDEAINTWFNEFGTAVGAAAAGQSWEIDEPGFVFGDIDLNFAANALDNSNGVPSTAPEDVSMALGWNIALAAGQTAYASFTLSTDRPNAGFYLSHTDPQSQATIYFSSTKIIRGGGTNVPDGGWTLAMLGASLTLMGAARRLRSSQGKLPPA